MKLVKGIYFPDYDTHFETVIDDEGNYQKRQFDAVMKYIKPEDRGLFIDVGAHVGLWSKMAIKAGFDQIIAFEPNKETFECLFANCANIILGNVALSDEETTGSLICEKEDNSGAIRLDKGDKVEVWVFDEYWNRHKKINDDYNATTFPEYRTDFQQIFKNKTLVKIDVQGYEAKVVRGMTNFIKEYKPIIIVEQWLDGKEDLEATEYLKSLGMKILEKVGKEVILGWLK